MTGNVFSSYSCFDGTRLVLTGSLPDVACAVQQHCAAPGPVLVFDNRSGRSIDLDTRGSEAQMLERLAQAYPAAAVQGALVPDPAEPAMQEPVARGRGRPRLGVQAREVTLLPRHWEWLAGQPGGASVALRKLVEEARRASGEKDRLRQAGERAYHFMQAMAGDLPAFEEASRALFAHDLQRLESLAAAWPADIRRHALWLARGEAEEGGEGAAAVQPL